MINREEKPMVKTLGMTNNDVKLFLDMLVKANYGQLSVMDDAIDNEIKKRRRMDKNER